MKRVFHTRIHSHYTTGVMTDTTVLDDALIALIRHYELRSLEVESFEAKGEARVSIGCGGHRVVAVVRPVAGEESLLRVQVELVDGRTIRQLPRTRTRGDGPPDALPDLIEEIVGRVGAVREAEENRVA